MWGLLILLLGGALLLGPIGFFLALGPNKRAPPSNNIRRPHMHASARTSYR